MSSMCSFLFFSEFIKACGRELRNSNFLYLLWFLFSAPKFPTAINLDSQNRIPLEGIELIFTVRFNEGKKIKIKSSNLYSSLYIFKLLKWLV